MAPSAQAHKRAHSLLLFEKLLNLRDSASPLTLILDSLEQSAEPLLHEFMRRAKLERAKIVFVSFATIKKPALADIFIRARGKSLKTLAAEITSHVAPPKPSTTKDAKPVIQKSLILLDTLNPASSQTPSHLPAFFAAAIPPTASLVAVYHTDVPALPPPLPNHHLPNHHLPNHHLPNHHHQYHYHQQYQYQPDPLTLLTHLATTIFRVSGLGQAVAARRARERSLAAPEWGLREGREGVLVGLLRDGDGNGNGVGVGVGFGDMDGGVVVEMEMRRRSGRAVAETFVLSAGRAGGGGGGVVVMVMGDHPAFRSAVGEEGEGGEEEMEASFNLGLTEKQRRDREGVVLPYFDAQTEVGGGEGGRILYDMGREDDFDEEEDEI
ncbi:Elongator complex protein 5 [Chaetomium fimeti]|uniref:Elongator complex protein 5 n=1 Tax=Chaetomium fimeti TaxID=1854472 RepID=A0AAE0HJ47_9PEZI|nr:Elongator complex protein 5 [Chaetomium fimeti]